MELPKNNDELRDTILKELAITESLIRQESLEQSSRSFFWSFQSDLAEQVAMQMRTVLKDVEARTATNYRQHANTQKIKITEGQVKEFVNSHTDVTDGRDKLANAILRANILKSAKFAFFQRGRILIALLGGGISPEDIDTKQLEKEEE